MLAPRNFRHQLSPAQQRRKRHLHRPDHALAVEAADSGEQYFQLA